MAADFLKLRRYGPGIGKPCSGTRQKMPGRAGEISLPNQSEILPITSKPMI
jgi:hypothetical protein